MVVARSLSCHRTLAQNWTQHRKDFGRFRRSLVEGGVGPVRHAQQLRRNLWHHTLCQDQASHPARAGRCRNAASPPLATVKERHSEDEKCGEPHSALQLLILLPWRTCNINTPHPQSPSPSAQIDKLALEPTSACQMVTWLLANLLAGVDLVPPVDFRAKSRQRLRQLLQPRVVHACVRRTPNGGLRGAPKKHGGFRPLPGRNFKKRLHIF